MELNNEILSNISDNAMVLTEYIADEEEFSSKLFKILDSFNLKTKNKTIDDAYISLEDSLQAFINDEKFITCTIKTNNKDGLCFLKVPTEYFLSKEFDLSEWSIKYTKPNFEVKRCYELNLEFYHQSIGERIIDNI